ncbi:MAG: PRC-barrel domain-containing protein [Acidobacteriota bacterium]|nr:PRC-barrel domain-containing protein [Acidobacteriota bacterium]
MLRKLRDLEEFVVEASDGEVGTVKDFLVDDDSWTIKHLVVQTGGFFDGRRVLISPASFRQADWEGNRFLLALTVDKVKNSPSVDVDKPVSRQHERDFALYYGYPIYGGAVGLGGLGAYPGLLAGGGPGATFSGSSDQAPGDVHLRSAAKLRGYHIQGSDETIGHVDDFIVDDESWELRYLVIDTSNWWLGKKVLVAPRWASRVSWEEQKVYVDMSRQAIKNSPVWNAAAAVEREYEIRLYDHYGRLAYWAGDKRPKDAQQPQQADAAR